MASAKALGRTTAMQPDSTAERPRNSQNYRDVVVVLDVAQFAFYVPEAVGTEGCLRAACSSENTSVS